MSLSELNARARETLRLVVESWVDTGGPVGSRALSQQLAGGLSPATVRAVLADLESRGLLYAPHASAGRLPTDAGLRLFVDGLLGEGRLSPATRRAIEARFAGRGRSLDRVLEDTSTLMSSLGRCAGLVLAPKVDESRLKHVEFVPLGPGRALVILVSAEGMVENRVIDLPPGVTPATLTEAGNYLSAMVAGRSLRDARGRVAADIAENRTIVNRLAARVVEAGLATWSGGGNGTDQAPGGREGRMLIIRGQANLLSDVHALAELESIRALFSALETRETLLKLLECAQDAEGVRIFIGADNPLFALSGCSVIVSPYRDGEERVVGAVGVVGPTRMNYARIIPMVDYTAQVVEKMMRREERP